MELSNSEIEQFLKIEKQIIGSADYSNNAGKGIFDETEATDTSITMTTTYS
ncbi:hypothetical protein [Sphingobacterium detergens]|uniref:Uncharacterized protein n=1 Tax=Sphingobacterium detergens TaxID=1145106 RepID=A0A420ADH9_SPHD1|nr:hypothetical protein [Sphingobacterium detergens]RKE42568.1 hypothetical protein DFQ12_5481 [Sphingobacterium detergens]